MTERTIRIFFAWQSDSPPAGNRSAIRRALAAATAAIEAATPGLIVELDEATRDMLGADNVPRSIMEKIEAADAFVGDVTNITAVRGDAAARPSPNPNVVFEVGYAAANLGWCRLILLTNLAQGDHRDLPFDFDRQRVSGYRAEKGTTGEVRALEDLLTVAIQAILDGDPPRRAEELAAGPEATRRGRDLDAIRRALSAISIANLEDMIERLPRVIENSDEDFYYSFRAVVDAGVFYIHDPELRAAVTGLRDAWSEAMNYGEHYRDTGRGHRHVFSNPGDAPLTESQDVAWKAIDAARWDMRHHLDAILAIVRERYVEIDPLKTSRVAFDRYRRETAELEARYGGIAE